MPACYIMASCHLLAYAPYSVHSNMRAAESAYSLAMHVIAMCQCYNYTVALQSSRAISHDTITSTHVLRFLHFSAFLSHNLPYALSLTLRKP